ncbi:MAG: hypothetical protein CL843_12660 [Crocinitomicaceae bacterium]|nr:hypothetical protein [Crocinitomicaceae bacterium]|tara:strand:+ start:6148 stop:7155 length:1008 start_codon:yes stop_codon:yes gene_type:complete
MKALKIIGLVVVSIILIILVVGYTQDDKLVVSRSTIVHAPIDVVFDQVNDLKKRTQWSPWENMDSTMTFEFSDKTKGEGAQYSWSSKNQGSGSLVYTKVIDNQLIESNVDFGPSGKITGVFAFEEAPDGVKVTWNMESEEISNPLTRLGMAIMKPGMESVFDMGLDSLAAAAERATSSALPAGISIEEVTPVTYISVIDSCSWEVMEQHYAKDYGQLMEFIGSNNIELTGMPFSFYHVWDEKKAFAVFEPALAVNPETVPDESGYEVKQSYEGTAVKGTHKGNYDNLGSTWESLYAYVGKEGLEFNGSPWEVYVTDPGQEPDTSKWITEIYIPVK